MQWGAIIILFALSSDWNCSSEVRARAVHILLTLSPGTHTVFADGIAEVLLNKELELAGSRSRSFAGSAVHLVRTRVLQTLLVLEPLLSKVYTCLDNLAEIYLLKGVGISKYIESEWKSSENWGERKSQVRVPAFWIFSTSKVLNLVVP